MNLSTSAYISVILLLLFSGFARAQETGTITGKVNKLTPENTYEPVEDANVSIFISAKTNKITASTNEDGIYTLSSVPAGTYSIKAEKVGFKPNEKSSIEVKAGDTLAINFILNEETYTTEEIDVISERFRQAQNDMRTSLMNVSPRTSQTLPGVGEDVLRSLQTLPGVTAPNDFSSQLVVRGSGPDQNLIIMDDVEIFNP